jgi:hypothetical protein
VKFTIGLFQQHCIEEIERIAVLLEKREGSRLPYITLGSDKEPVNKSHSGARTYKIKTGN